MIMGPRTVIVVPHVGHGASRCSPGASRGDLIAVHGSFGATRGSGGDMRGGFDAVRVGNGTPCGSRETRIDTSHLALDVCAA